jgi:NAD(P)-dependent dehydrogenase (short-subunit alcohol dehydrogenase family)
MELKKFNIRVVNVAPGDFKTDIASRRIDTKLNKMSLYNTDYKESIQSANKHVNEADDPEIIAILIYKIIISESPKIHYKVGTFIQKFSIILKMLLPDKLFEKILLKYSKN